jgi:hypothetical protein
MIHVIPLAGGKVVVRNLNRERWKASLIPLIEIDHRASFFSEEDPKVFQNDIL